MPIQEEYRQRALEKVNTLKEAIKDFLKDIVESVDAEDLEMGISERVEIREDLWRDAVEENNYMEVVYTEIMEHHDGAYLKVTFRNSVEDAHADRYVSVRSSGRVEITHAFFVKLNSVGVRIEKKPDGSFLAFFKLL